MLTFSALDVHYFHYKKKKIHVINNYIQLSSAYCINIFIINDFDPLKSTRILSNHVCEFDFYRTSWI